MTHQPKIKMITALFLHREEAVSAYAWLQQHGFETRDISVLMSDKVAPLFTAETGVERVEQKQLAAPGAQATGAVGAGLTMALAAGVGTLIAGIGLVTTGPIGLILAASIPGAMVGGLIGGLIGYGFPEAGAKVYEQAIKDGAVAIGVTPHEHHDVDLIEKKFVELHGEQLLRF